jgi:hypothetical protein
MEEEGSREEGDVEIECVRHCTTVMVKSRCQPPLLNDTLRRRRRRVYSSRQTTAHVATTLRMVVRLCIRLVVKATTCEAKAKAKASTSKAKTKAKDLTFEAKAKAEDLTSEAKA